MKRVIAIYLSLIPLLCFGVTRHVAIDGSQTYTSIQTAVNDAVSGDLVLVHPGRYMENINLSNKSDIVLASLEYTTADSSYISTTIIDGSTSNTSTILCYENTINCTISGLSITGGSGYDFLHGASPWQISGGGILIYQNNVVLLEKLNIFGNHAATGGGISIGSPNTVYMSGVNIYNNYARYLGGGLGFGSNPTLGAPNIVFSQTERCSIYNNFAQWGMDIHWHYIHGGTLAVYLKKFTVPQWEKYYADYYDSSYPPSPYTVFDVQEAYLQPIDADLYVSPVGDDNNDGLSPASPLKTPSLAMQRIASNAQQPRTVHLLAGEHHNLMGGEYIPIAIKDYTILQGVSEAETRLYGENMLEGTGVITMGIERYGMTLKDLSITTSHASAMFSWGVHDCLVENVSIVNSTVDKWIVAMGYNTSTFEMRNITMRNNEAYCYDFGLHLTGFQITLDNILIADSKVASLPISEFDQGGGGFDIYITDSLIVRNSKFINNTHYSVDGWANFRVIGDDEHPIETIVFDNCLFANNSTYGGARDLNFVFGLVNNITNCTFANNIGTYPAHLFIEAETNNIINCLFSNNNATYEIKADDSTLVENCLFTRDRFLYQTFNGMPLNWGTNNITGADPLFAGTDPSLPSSYYLFSDEVNGYSPAIDAGTLSQDILPEGYTVPMHDAFGFNRVHGQSIDIGCFESQGYTGLQDELLPSANAFYLTNYPNPFNPETTISYSVPKDAKVLLCIYNTKGQLVRTLVNEAKLSGTHRVVWNGADDNGKQVSSGIYFTRMVTEGKTLTTKMLMLK